MRGRASRRSSFLAELALLCALGGAARAGDETTADDAPLSLRARLALHREHAAAAEAAGDRARAAKDLAHACILEAFTGGAAAPVCRRAEELAVASGSRDALATVAARRAGVLAWSLDFAGGRAESLRALELSADRPGSYPTLIALLVLGGSAIELGQYDAADAYLRLDLALAERAGDREVVSFAHQYLARNLGFLGAMAAAGDEARAALAVAREAGDVNAEMFGYWILADLEQGSGRVAEAVAAYEAGLARAETMGGPIQLSIFLGNLAFSYLSVGRTAESRQLIDRARTLLAQGLVPQGWSRVIDNIEGSLFVAEGRDRDAAAAFGRVRGYARGGWAVSFSAVQEGRARRRLGDLAGARAALEEGIAGIEASRPSGAIEPVRTSFGAKHSSVYRELVALLWQMDGQASAARSLGIAEAGRARALLDVLAATGVAGRPRPLGASEIQARLPVGTLLLEYVSLDDELLAFAVTAAEVRELALPGAAGGEELARRVAYFRQLVEEARAPAELTQAGRRLYEELVAPALAGHDDVTTLIIAPDGPLHELPFDALVRGDRFLAQDLTVLSTPSASLLVASSSPRAPSGGLLAVADPPTRPGLRELPSSVVEARGAARRAPGGVMLSGAAATERHLRESGLDRVGILHFATHAVVEDVAPLRSALVLAPGDGDDGFLRAGEIYPLRLQADLVVLSACRSGLGRLAGGEGLLSLERAFLFAGAHAVVATLWEISDGSSVDLMEAFYGELARGAPTSAALATAKRAILAAGGPPRTWAGYVVVGSPDGHVGRLTPAKRSPTWPRLTAGLFALLAIGCALLAGRQSILGWTTARRRLPSMGSTHPGGPP